jgi:hypothetical protein
MPVASLVSHDVSHAQVIWRNGELIPWDEAVVMPIVQVDGLPVGDGKMGPMTRAIDRAYHDLVRGVDAAHEAWRSAVWQ